jgi:hypothetical protein
MAFSAAVVNDAQGSFGNVFYRVYQLTDVQAAGSSLTISGAKRIIYASANNQTDTDEVMYCNWTSNVITILCGTNDDDGYLFVIYK